MIEITTTGSGCIKVAELEQNTDRAPFTQKQILSLEPVKDMLKFREEMLAVALRYPHNSLHWNTHKTTIFLY